MDRSDWAEGPPSVPTKFGATPYTLDVCPGYVVRLPIVSECARAWRAYDKGQLEQYAPNTSALIWEGVLELANAVDRYSADQIALASKGVK